MSFEKYNISMFCTQCGTDNKTLEAFCGTCGSSMKKAEIAHPDPSPSNKALDLKPVYTDTQPQSNSTSQAPYSTQHYPEQAIYGGQSYPVKWQDATKITIGVLLIIAGIWFSFLTLIFLSEYPTGALIFFIFLTAIPIFVGYHLLNRFMGGWDMMKASLSTFLIGIVIYIYGIFAFLFILDAFLGGFF